MARDLREITMASPKLFAMNATRWLSGEIAALSPKCVRTSMFEGKCCSGSSGDLWPRGSIKQEDRMTTKVRTGRSYHPRTTGVAVAITTLKLGQKHRSGSSVSRSYRSSAAATRDGERTLTMLQQTAT